MLPYLLHERKKTCATGGVCHQGIRQTYVYIGFLAALTALMRGEETHPPQQSSCRAEEKLWCIGLYVCSVDAIHSRPINTLNFFRPSGPIALSLADATRPFSNPSWFSQCIPSPQPRPPSRARTERHSSPLHCSRWQLLAVLQIVRIRWLAGLVLNHEMKIELMIRPCLCTCYILISLPCASHWI